MAHSGQFSTDKGDFFYRAVSHTNEVTETFTDDVTDQNIKEPGYLVLEIIDRDTEAVQYETIINLPLESWEDVEFTLAYDWGDEGSRAFA